MRVAHPQGGQYPFPQQILVGQANSGPGCHFSYIEGNITVSKGATWFGEERKVLQALPRHRLCFFCVIEV